MVDSSSRLSISSYRGIKPDLSSHELINNIISNDLHPILFQSLSTLDETISPSRSILLKILDSHLSSTDRQNPSPNPNGFLIPLFQSLSGYALASMRFKADDVRLPKIFEGLVLVCEGLSTIGLAVQGRRDRGEQGGGGDDELVRDMKTEIVRPIISMSIHLERNDSANIMQTY